MHKLLEGIQNFHDRKIAKYSQLFQRLSTEGQKPHTLFITCSDSRVIAELITQSKPGDLFVVKNVGNIVPPSSVTGSTNSTAAAIEFAVEELEVEDIVVCGHSQCGAMTALVEKAINGPNKETDERMPHLRLWLRLAAPVKEMIRQRHDALSAEPETLLREAMEANILFALDNLRTYPGVEKRIAAGKLQLHAWWFKIATAEIYAYQEEAKAFLPLINVCPPKSSEEVSEEAAKA